MGHHSVPNPTLETGQTFGTDIGTRDKIDPRGHPDATSLALAIEVAFGIVVGFCSFVGGIYGEAD